MDTLRGNFDTGNLADDGQDWDATVDAPEQESVRELPPEAIGQDERRMQVRAYNHWASLLGEATFPSIEDLEPHNLTDFGPNSVLLDFSSGIENPIVVFLGDKLGDECGAEGRIERLSDVPPRSLLSRITDHYMQILANQAPIGFEAEFVNQRGSSILYRGILLPFSSDDETIDFIYGVINWKEMADAATADELLLEIGQALEIDEEEEVEDEDEAHKHHADALIEWADSPAQESETDLPEDVPTIGEAIEDEHDDNVASFAGIASEGDADEDDLPMPDFGHLSLDDVEYDEYGEEYDEDEGEEDDSDAGYSFASLTDYIEAPAKKAIDLDADRFDPADYRVEPEDEFSEATSEDAAFEGREIEGPTSEDEEEPLDLHEVFEELPVDPIAEDNFEKPVAEPAEEPAPVAAELTDVEAPAAEPAPVEADLDDEIEDTIEDAPDELSTDAGLYDCLASARELAQNARVSEDRSRQALYAAVGRAYDFSLAAEAEPDAYNELIEDAGLTVQDRAPMTPIVKLVFGVDYDKTRLTEYAAVLSHAHRVGIERGTLADFLGAAEGGLKAVVNAERRLRREESGKVVEDEGDVRARLAKKLRELDEIMLEALSGEGPEFSLVMVRRDGSGNVALIGEIADDVSLIERAGKRLVG